MIASTGVTVPGKRPDFDPEPLLIFPPYSLDPANNCVWLGLEKLRLRAKSVAVLKYLAENSNRLVSKQELAAAIWPHTRVVDAVLRVSIQEIRRALGDHASAPKFIETVGSKGYQFIASVNLGLSDGGATANPVVGRQTELSFLRRQLENAHKGRRQITFITGESGIGKTTLVDAFIRTVAAGNGIVVARGQCIEPYGAGEAYLPVWDAIEQLCISEPAKYSVDLLRHCAPSWLLNLSTLITPEERIQLMRQTVSVTPERRLREAAIYFEQLAVERTLVLVLEDLHWADPSTLALISFMARRRQVARLFVLATYRAGEIGRQLNRGLGETVSELGLHHLSSILPLKLLNRDVVHEYLAARFQTSQISDEIKSIVYDRSDGNPLFMVNVTDYLIAENALMRKQGAIVLARDISANATPASLRQLIEWQGEALDRDDQELLAAASVAGTKFSTASVAAALVLSLEVVEARCRRLAEREQFFHRAGSSRWPDGSLSSVYNFNHGLYQNVIYDLIDDAKKARLHRRVGERLEAGHHGATAAVAGELAVHFECAGDFGRAGTYLVEAAHSAAAQGAFKEVIAYASKALPIVQMLPSQPARSELELDLQSLLGMALANTKGFAAKEAKEPFLKARRLYEQVSDVVPLFRALVGLWTYHVVRADWPIALDLIKKMLDHAKRTRNQVFYIHSRAAAGITELHLGRFDSARKMFERSKVVYSRLEPGSLRPVFGWDSGVAAMGYNSLALWFLGYPDKSIRELNAAITLARQLSSPFDSALAHTLAATAATFRNDSNDGLLNAETVIRISTEHGFAHWQALGTAMKGAALSSMGRPKEGIDLLLDGISRWQLTGAEMAMPALHAMLARAYGSANRITTALSCVEKALNGSRQNDEVYYDVELYRLRGALLMQKGSRRATARRSEIEASFVHALKIARGQKAHSLALRAALDLYRLWQRDGKRKEALTLLRKAYRLFTEGFDTADLRLARELMAG